MQAYRFETTVLEDGSIKLPDFKKFANTQVEIILFPKVKRKKKVITTDIPEKKQSFEEFLDKWAGFAKSDLTDEEIDNIRYESIMEKHK